MESNNEAGRMHWCTQRIVDVNDSWSYYRDQIKQYGYSKEFGNLTNLLPSTSRSKSSPNQTVIDVKKDSSKAKAENVVVCSRTSSNNSSRKELSFAKCCLSRQRKLSWWNLKTWWQRKRQSNSWVTQWKTTPAKNSRTSKAHVSFPLRFLCSRNIS